MERDVINCSSDIISCLNFIHWILIFCLQRFWFFVLFFIVSRIIKFKNVSAFRRSCRRSWTSAQNKWCQKNVHGFRTRSKFWRKSSLFFLHILFLISSSCCYCCFYRVSFFKVRSFSQLRNEFSDVDTFYLGTGTLNSPFKRSRSRGAVVVDPTGAVRAERQVRARSKSRSRILYAPENEIIKATPTGNT